MEKWASISFGKGGTKSLSPLLLFLLVSLGATSAVASDRLNLVVESVPSGAMIIVNQQLLGRTPCRIQLPRAQKEAGYTVLRVVPGSFIGQYVQTRVFSGNEELPDYLRFDLRKPPPDPAMDIYFN